MAPRGRPPRTAVYERLDREVAVVRERLGGLPSPLEARAVWSSIWHEEAHNSTALEGNTLVLREVEALLERGETVGQKDLRDYLDVQGYAKAAEWVYTQANERARTRDLVTIQEIRNIHAIALGLVWEVAAPPHALPEEIPGNWRRHNIQPFSRGMAPPDFGLISAEVAGWVERTNAMRNDERPVVLRVAAAHAEFERIHPFLDGNGRTGRLLMNLLLVRLGFPPAIIRKTQRQLYLKALRQADAGKPEALGELVARATYENLMRFIVPAIAGPARLVPLASLVRPGISEIALRSAAARGRLRAVRDSAGTWRSTRAWVDEYRASRWDALKRPRGKRTPA